MRYDEDMQAKLLDGEALQNHRSSVTGARGNVDVSEYDIVSPNGDIIGTLSVREEMDPHPPFQTNRNVTRSDN